MQMTAKEPIEWIKFVFPSLTGSKLEIDSGLLSQWNDDLLLAMNSIQIICDTCPPLKASLLNHVEELITNLMNHYFNLSVGMNEVHFFESPAEMEHYLDMSYMDTLVGSLRVVIETYEMYVERWRQLSSTPEQSFFQIPTIRNKSRSKARSKEPKTRPNIPREARDILSQWFRENVENPYPKAQDKEKLSELTGLSIKKVENWFINERSRKWHLYTRSPSVN